MFLILIILVTWFHASFLNFLFWNFSPIQFIGYLVINLEFFSCCWEAYFIKKWTQNLAYFNTREIYYKPKLLLNIFYHQIICLHIGWNKKTYGWTFKQENFLWAFIKLKIFFIYLNCCEGTIIKTFSKPFQGWPNALSIIPINPPVIFISISIR